MNKFKDETVKIIIKRDLSLTDIEHYICNIDFTRYNNQITRTEIDEKTFTEIRQYIERKLRDFARQRKY